MKTYKELSEVVQAKILERYTDSELENPYISLEEVKNKFNTLVEYLWFTEEGELIGGFHSTFIAFEKTKELKEAMKFLPENDNWGKL